MHKHIQYQTKRETELRYTANKLTDETDEINETMSHHDNQRETQEKMRNKLKAHENKTAVSG